MRSFAALREISICADSAVQISFSHEEAQEVTKTGETI
jgi:hypothetical protein